MQRMTNNAGIPLAAAVWLAHDSYDGYTEDPNTISATTLLRPVRQTILKSRVTLEDRVPDISEYINSRFGQALHFGIEDAWVRHYATSLKKLGYPARAIEAIEINPATPDPDKIQVYTEVRASRTIVVDGVTYIISGQLDLCIEGRLQDVKKTSVWGYQKNKGLEDGKWIKQGSLYRWIHRDKVTSDQATIQYLLMDWQGMMRHRDPSYPPHALPHRDFNLMPLDETERFICTQLRTLKQYWDAPDEEIPDCSDEDLWRSEAQHKYYANFSDGDQIPYGTRSSKNFSDLGEALLHKNQKGKGTVRTFPGLVKACGFCEAASICGQRLRLIKSGDIEIKE